MYLYALCFMLTQLERENGNVIKSPLFLNHMMIFIQIAKEENHWNTYAKQLF